MEKRPLIPVEVKRFLAAMVAIIVLIALAALVVDILYAQ